MPLEFAIPFYLGAAAYLTAAAAGLEYARAGDAAMLPVGRWAAFAGSACLVAVFVARWWHYHLPPLSGLGDSLNLFLIFCTGIALMVQRGQRLAPLLAFYLPALGMMALLAALLAPRTLTTPPRDLAGLPLAIHVIPIFIAFALFFMASLTSVVYLFKARHLKNHDTLGFVNKVPSLERLDQVLMRLISVGYPVFVFTFVLGFFYAWTERDLLDRYWFVSSKVVFAFVMAAFYAVSFHGRQFGWLRGPRLARFVFFGFMFLLATYLAFKLLNAAEYSFWGTPV